MPRTLVYDGDCPMCGWIAERCGGLGLAAEPDRKPYQEFEGELARRMDEAGIRNEMLVLDPSSGELRAGMEGFLWLVEESPWRWLSGFLALAPVSWVLRHGYRTIAYNRRLIAPPPAGVVCACDPDPHRGYRFLFFALLFLVACGLGALLWIALSPILQAIL